MYKFSETTFIHPDTLVAIKQIIISWEPEVTKMDVENVLNDFKTFLLRDKSKDFPNDIIQTAFLEVVNHYKSPRIKTSLKLENATSLVFNVRLHAYTDPYTFAELLYQKLLERIKDSECIEVFTLSFSPTVLDPILNEMQQAVMLWYRSVPIWSVIGNNNIDELPKI